MGGGEYLKRRAEKSEWKGGGRGETEELEVGAEGQAPEDSEQRAALNSANWPEGGLQLSSKENHFCHLEVGVGKEEST